MTDPLGTAWTVNWSPLSPVTETNIYKRYLQLVKGILQTLQPFKDYPVFIEQYAFSQSGNDSSRKLIELGGVLRTLLVDAGHPSPIAITSSRVKKTFSGSGKSNKEGMEQAWQTLHRGIDFVESMGLRRNKRVQHPVEDMVDAIAVALSGLHHHV